MFEDNNIDFETRLAASLEERRLADELSIRRSLLATPIFQLIARQNSNVLSERLINGVIVSAIWYSDRRDGMLGRLSVHHAKEIAEDYPEHQAHPTIRYLLNTKTSQNGARIDQESDKIFSNSIIKGLLEKAYSDDDVISVAAMLTHIHTNSVRDRKMQQIRELGQSKHIDVKAGPFGKLKTTMQAIGSILAIISKPRSRSHYVGIGTILASNAPSWVAYIKMRNKVKD